MDGENERIGERLRRRWERLGTWVARLLMAVVLLVPTAVIGYSVLTVRSAWRSVEREAAAFEVPDGFTEAEVVRQGPRFCVLVCTSDHASVTVLMTTTLPVADACAVLEQEMGRLVGPIEQVDGDRCGWAGPVDGDVAAIGTVASRTLDFERYGSAGVYGYAWTDAAEVPDSELVVWI